MGEVGMLGLLRPVGAAMRARSSACIGCGHGRRDGKREAAFGEITLSQAGAKPTAIGSNRCSAHSPVAKVGITMHWSDEERTVGGRFRVSSNSPRERRRHSLRRRSVL